MKYDRALLEKAVEIYPKEKGRNFVPASKLSQKQLSAAIKHIDKYIKPEDVVAFLDSTLFLSGKEGVILTLEKIASSDGGDPCGRRPFYWACGCGVCPEGHRAGRRHGPGAV